MTRTRPIMGTSSRPAQGLRAESGPAEPDPARVPEGRPFGGWLAVLDRYAVQYLILDKERDGGLLSRVRARTGWVVDFEDEASVLYSRSLAGAS